MLEIFAGCLPDLARCGFGVGVGAGSEFSVSSKSSGVASGVSRSSLSCWEIEESVCSILTSAGVSGGETFLQERTSGSAGGSAMVGSATIGSAGSAVSFSAVSLF